MLNITNYSSSISNYTSYFLAKESIKNLYSDLESEPVTQQHHTYSQSKKEAQEQNNLSAEQLKTIDAEIKFLVSSWLDDYEKTLFHGNTLQEVLHEKGGV